MRPPAAPLLVLLLVACRSPDTPAGATPARLAAPPAVTADSLVAEPVPGVRVALAFPRLAGADAANATLRQAAAAFAREVQPRQGPGPQRPFDLFALEGGFETEYVGPDVYSGVLSAHRFTGGAHGTHYYVPLTVDMRTGAALGFADFVADEGAAREALGPLLHRALVGELARRAGASRGEAEAWVRSYNGGPAELPPDAVVALGADSLVVYAAPYELLSYAAGAFRLPIAYADAPGVWRPDGPVARVRNR